MIFVEALSFFPNTYMMEDYVLTWSLMILDLWNMMQ